MRQTIIEAIGLNVETGAADVRVNVVETAAADGEPAVVNERMGKVEPQHSGERGLMELNDELGYFDDAPPVADASRLTGMVDLLRRYAKPDPVPPGFTGKRSVLNAVIVSKRSDAVMLRFRLIEYVHGRERLARWHRTSIEPGTDVAAQLAAVNADITRRPGLRAAPVGPGCCDLVEAVCDLVHTPQKMKSAIRKA